MFLHEIVWDSYEMSAVDMKNFLPTALQKKTDGKKRAFLFLHWAFRTEKPIYCSEPELLILCQSQDLCQPNQVWANY